MKQAMLILGFAIAFVAGATVPVTAQSYDDDYAYAAQDAGDFDDENDDAAAVGDDEAADDITDDDSAADLDDDDRGYDDAGDTAAYAGSDDDDGESRCAAQFRSFDAASGTYLTYGGERVPCPYL